MPSEMKADFLDAHKRHWCDAERLFLAERYANAAHLYGIAAECGLKQLMVRFGMLVNDLTGSPKKKKDREHADGIWTRYESYRGHSTEGVNYGLPDENPFNNWDISDRYAHQSNFDQTSVKSYQDGARAICELIKKARRDGLLE